MIPIVDIVTRRLATSNHDRHRIENTERYVSRS